MTKDSLNNLATRLLTKFGTTELLLTSNLSEIWNDEAGEYIEEIQKTDLLFSKISETSFKFKDIYQLKYDEMLCIVQSANKIKKDSKLEVNGAIYTVSKSEDISFKNDNIVYVLVIKEVQ